MIVLGIDPGTATTGYGIIKIKSRDFFNCLDYGIISTSSKSNPADRLNQINTEIIKIIEDYQPDVLAIEKIFFFKNAKTIVPISQVRGIILMIAAQKKIPIYEFTPLQAKMATVGYGRAEKKQVQEMIKLLLNLNEIPKPDDAADALAIAMCYISSYCKE